MKEKKEKQNSVCTVEQLKAYVDMTPAEEEHLRQIIKCHPMRVSPYYLSLIDMEDPDDPIRKMAIPSFEELDLEGSYDTSGEVENTKLPGLQHKYRETALILATNRCATYCRHCFRKRLVGLPSEEIIKRFDDAINYVQKHSEINNVLVSGGDPLVLSNKIIESFLSALAAIPHLKYVRIGSRTPVTLPSRFDDDELLSIFKEYSKPARRLYVVTQFNHPKEITGQSTRAVDKLIKSGVILSNQTVLLKGVNDNPDTLASLLNSLVSIGVAPYYVFQCRPVRRVKRHFQIPLSKGIEIVEQAKEKCNGHGKRFKYVMSHRNGKIEILGRLEDEIYFKYHQAKNRGDLGKIFKLKLDGKTMWLNDFI